MLETIIFVRIKYLNNTMHQVPLELHSCCPACKQYSYHLIHSNTIKFIPPTVTVLFQANYAYWTVKASDFHMLVLIMKMLLIRQDKHLHMLTLQTYSNKVFGQDHLHRIFFHSHIYLVGFHLRFKKEESLINGNYYTINSLHNNPFLLIKAVLQHASVTVRQFV